MLWKIHEIVVWPQYSKIDFCGILRRTTSLQLFFLNSMEKSHLKIYTLRFWFKKISCGFFHLIRGIFSFISFMKKTLEIILIFSSKFLFCLFTGFIFLKTTFFHLPISRYSRQKNWLTFHKIEYFYIWNMTQKYIHTYKLRFIHSVWSWT